MTDQIDFDNFNPNDWEPGEKLTFLDGTRIIGEGGIVIEGFNGGLVHRLKDGQVQCYLGSQERWRSASIGVTQLYRAVRKRVPLTPEQVGERIAESRRTGKAGISVYDGREVCLCVRNGGDNWRPMQESEAIYLTPNPTPKPRRSLPLPDALRWMAENPGKVMWTKLGSSYRWEAEPGRLMFRDRESLKWDLSDAVVGHDARHNACLYLDPPEVVG